MDFWVILIAAYVLSAVIAVVMTYREQQRRGERSPVYSVIGYLLCTIWPVVAAFMVIFYRPIPAKAATASRLR